MAGPAAREGETPAGPPVTRRLALVFPGFEPMPVEAHMQRFTREAQKNAPVYGMRCTIGIPVFQDAAADRPTTGEVDVAAEGDGWRTRSAVVVYGLGDLNALYAGRPRVVRLMRGLGALGAFVLTGTVFRFAVTSWRYVLFFLYPVLLTLVMLALAAGAALVPAGIFGSAHLLWSLPLGLAVFWLLFLFAARHMHYLLMMDDWACARDIARGAAPEIGARIALIGADLRARVEATDAEEIVFAAHSFGAITAMLVLARALEGGLAASRAGLLTAGSSLLKVALHPASRELRAATAKVVDAGCPWLDVQSLTDPMNFYGANPAKVLSIPGGRQPNTVKVRFRNQLSPETYRAIRRNFFRVHRQFVFAAERRHAYSFHAILLGPERFEDVALRGGLAETWRFP